MKALRVLVVDDQDLNLRAVARLLRLLGHGGALVNSGAKALEALARQRFDLVLLDRSMPEMDGLETLARIRASAAPGVASVPVVMLTGYDSQDDQQLYLRAGAAGSLSKPLESDSFSQLMRQLRLA